MAMDCTGCREGKHWKCMDIDPATVKTKGKGPDKVLVSWSLRPGRAYRSCVCQHRVQHIAPLMTIQMGVDE